MKRVLAAGAVLAATAAIAAPAASAAPAAIEAGTGGANAFSAQSFNHDAGTLAQMTSVGGTHNVTATGQGPDGGALFASSDISAGTTAVNGSQYVPVGVYPFSCTIHPGMSSSLNVNAGVPKQRPTLTLKVKSNSLDQALKKKEVKVAVAISGGSGESAVVNLKLGRKTIGRPREATATSTVKIGLTKGGRSALENKDKAKVTAQAEIDFGGPASAKGALK